MHRIVTLFIVLLLSAYSAHVDAFQRAKGAFVLGLSVYCYQQLPYLFSWVKHPGKYYGVQQKFEESADGSALWTVTLTSTDGQAYQIRVPLLKKTVPGVLQIWGQAVLKLLINDFCAHGVCLNNLPGFSLHTYADANNHCVVQLQIDAHRVIAEHIISRHYVVDKSNVGIENISHDQSMIQWLKYNAHASGLGLQNMCKLGCIVAGSYGCAKMINIL